MQLCTALAVAHFSPAPSVVCRASNLLLCIAAMLTEAGTQTVWTCVSVLCMSARSFAGQAAVCILGFAGSECSPEVTASGNLLPPCSKFKVRTPRRHKHHC